MYATKNEAKAAAREQGLKAGTFDIIGERKDGADTYAIREKAIAATVAKVFGTPKKGKGKAAPVAPVASDELGPCGIIRAFANANPTMSRADCIAALLAKNLHPATIKIQLKKADDRASRTRT